MATYYQAGFNDRQVLPANGRAFTLEEMQKYVGGYFEHLCLPSGKVLVMDEDGKSKHKPVNEIATRWARTAGIMANDCVVGDVLLCTRREAGYKEGSDEDGDED